MYPRFIHSSLWLTILLFNYSCDDKMYLRMTMANTDSYNSSKQVQVTLTTCIPKPLHVTLVKKKQKIEKQFNFFLGTKPIVSISLS